MFQPDPSGNSTETAWEGEPSSGELGGLGLNLERGGGPDRERMRYRMDLICGKVGGLYGGEEEGVWVIPRTSNPRSWDDSRPPSKLWAFSVWEVWVTSRTSCRQLDRHELKLTHAGEGWSLGLDPLPHPCNPGKANHMSRKWKDKVWSCHLLEVWNWERWLTSRVSEPWPWSSSNENASQARVALLGVVLQEQASPLLWEWWTYLKERKILVSS